MGMNHIILASHSALASGMMASAKFFGAPCEISVLEQTAAETGFEQKVDKLLEDCKEKNVVVFTDIVGGSVNQIFTRKLAGHRFHLVTGMNLAMVLECAFAEKPIDADFIRDTLDAAREQTCYMNDKLSEMMNDD